MEDLETPADPTVDDPPPRRYQPKKSGGVMRTITNILLLAALLGLGGLVAYLLSELNHRQYTIQTRHNELLVMKGRFLPIGYAPYRPSSEALERAYAPIPIPEGQVVQSPGSFDERSELDRALFAILADWARRGFGSNSADAAPDAPNYVERLALLPGLSEQQRVELRTLRGDVAYLEGQRRMAAVVAALEEAKQSFQRSIELGTSAPNDAGVWIVEIDRRIASFAQLPGQFDLQIPSDPVEPVLPAEPNKPSEGQKQPAEPPKPSESGKNWEL